MATSAIWEGFEITNRKSGDLVHQSARREHPSEGVSSSRRGRQARILCGVACAR